MTVWCAAPAASQHAADVREVRRRLPHGAADGQVRQVGRVDVLDDVRDEPEPVAHVAQRDDERGAGVGGEDQAHRVLLAADAERVHLEARLRGRQRRRDLEHVRAEDPLVARGRGRRCSPP